MEWWVDFDIAYTRVRLGYLLQLWGDKNEDTRACIQFAQVTSWTGLPSAITRYESTVNGERASDKQKIIVDP